MNKAAVFFEKHNMKDRIRHFDESSATVELAAAAIGCPLEQIAKTISLHTEMPCGCMVIVAAGDAKIDNRKFKSAFHRKAALLKREEVEPLTGYPVGGVCPFGLKPGVKVYLDISLKRFETVYTACGTPNSVIGLTADELWRFAEPVGWIDVCKGWREAGTTE